MQREGQYEDLNGILIEYLRRNITDTKLRMTYKQNCVIAKYCHMLSKSLEQSNHSQRHRTDPEYLNKSEFTVQKELLLPTLKHMLLEPGNNLETVSTVIEHYDPCLNFTEKRLDFTNIPGALFATTHSPDPHYHHTDSTIHLVTNHSSDSLTHPLVLFICLKMRSMDRS